MIQYRENDKVCAALGLVQVWEGKDILNQGGHFLIKLIEPNGVALGGHFGQTGDQRYLNLCSFLGK